MKIKTKKQLNLPQLIEWAMENEIRNEDFYSDVFNGFDKVKVSFDLYGDFYTDDHINKRFSFSIEDEFDITEDTVIPKLMTTFKKTCLNDDFGYQRVRVDENFPIKLMLNKSEAHGEQVETLHIVNDDGTHTLIWTHEKGMVE